MWQSKSTLQFPQEIRTQENKKRKKHRRIIWMLALQKILSYRIEYQSLRQRTKMHKFNLKLYQTGQCQKCTSYVRIHIRCRTICTSDCRRCMHSHCICIAQAMEGTEQHIATALCREMHKMSVPSSSTETDGRTVDMAHRWYYLRFLLVCTSHCTAFRFVEYYFKRLRSGIYLYLFGEVHIGHALDPQEFMK